MERCTYITCNGWFDRPFVRIPSEWYSNIEFDISVCGSFVFSLQCYLDLKDVLFLRIFHTNIINNQGEIDGGSYRVSIVMGWFFLDGICMVPGVLLGSHVWSINIVSGNTWPWSLLQICTCYLPCYWGCRRQWIILISQKCGSLCILLGPCACLGRNILHPHTWSGRLCQRLHYLHAFLLWSYLPWGWWLLWDSPIDSLLGWVWFGEYLFFEVRYFIQLSHISLFCPSACHCGIYLPWCWWQHVVSIPVTGGWDCCTLGFFILSRLFKLHPCTPIVYLLCHGGCGLLFVSLCLYLFRVYTYVNIFPSVKCCFFCPLPWKNFVLVVKCGELVYVLFPLVVIVPVFARALYWVSIAG